MSRRYERASTVMTSDKSFEEWGEVSGDEFMATALIDRILHHCHIVNIPNSGRPSVKAQRKPPPVHAGGRRRVERDSGRVYIGRLCVQFSSAVDRIENVTLHDLFGDQRETVDLLSHVRGSQAHEHPTSRAIMIDSPVRRALYR
jgi:hypothetical protein